MTLDSRPSLDPTTGIGVVDGPEALDILHDPGCAAAIWQRAPLVPFQTWINTLEPAQLPSARLILRADAVRSAVSGICDGAGTPNGAERDQFLDDVAALAKVFAGLMATEWLRLRLDVVKTNACRKFHIDAVTARLVCTYRGTGTQYGILTGGVEPDTIFHGANRRAVLDARHGLAE